MTIREVSQTERKLVILLLLTKYPRRGESMTTHSGEQLTMTPVMVDDDPLASAYSEACVPQLYKVTPT